MLFPSQLRPLGVRRTAGVLLNWCGRQVESPRQIGTPYQIYLVYLLLSALFQ